LPELIYLDKWIADGSLSVSERRIANADASAGLTGSDPWINSMVGKVAWWLPGDIIFNRSEVDRWPVAWRPQRRGGIGLSYGGGWRDPWQRKTRYYPGMTIEPGNGFLYRAREAGDTDDSSPVWSTAIGQLIKDGSQVWECFSQAEISFEPILDSAPTMLEKNCSQGGNIVFSTDEIAHARYKLTGSPPGEFSVIIGSGVCGSWDRIVFNASNQQARIKANSADPGIIIPNNTAYRLLHDGSIIIKVE
jgi:hypothetical protein